MIATREVSSEAHWGSDPSVPLVNPKSQRVVSLAWKATALAGVSLLAPWETIRIIAMTILTGAAYGIVNDLFACRDCIEYFTAGHVYDGQLLRNRPLNTLNPNLNAVAWGMIATWHVCAIAGTFFAFFARFPIPGVVIKLTALQIAPYLIGGAMTALVISHIVSRIVFHKGMLFSDILSEEGCSEIFNKIKVPIAYQTRWLACDARNTVGYFSLLFGGGIFSCAMVAARIGLLIL